MTRFGSLTSMPKLSGRDRRTLMIGAAVVVGLLVVFRGFPAWRAWVHDSQATASTLTTRLAIAQQVANDTRGAGRRADSLSQMSLAFAPALIDGDTPAQATAALASYLSETAAGAGVQLSGVQLFVDSAAKGAELYHVRVRADGSGDVRGITGLFQLLESGRVPLVSVRNFSISQSEPNAPPNHAETLRISFEIEALARRIVDP